MGDDVCVDASGAHGRCERGYCAFPSSTCGPPGYRWDVTAGPMFAGQCVPQPDDLGLHDGADDLSFAEPDLSHADASMRPDFWCPADSVVCVDLAAAPDLARPGGCVGALIDCDGQTSTSCEVDSSRDNANCGRCGHACGGGSTCIASVCRVCSNVINLDGVPPLTHGTAPTAAVFGDLDGDGRPDLVELVGATVEARLGNASGTFASPTVTSVSSPNALALADLDGDGKLDLLIADDAGTVDVHRGTGAGGFGVPTSFAAGARPWSLAVADLNGDGHTDVVSANLDQTVSVLLGDGAGGLGAPLATTVSVSAGSPHLHLALADVTGDGSPDALVADDLDAAIYVLANDGAGALAAPVSHAAPGPASSVAAIDLDRNGAVDLVASIPQADTLAVWMNLGGGRFPTTAIRNTGVFAPTALVGADLNGDGFPDLAVAATGTASVGVLLNDRAGNLGAPLSVPVGGAPSDLAAADLDGDGRPELVAPVAARRQTALLYGPGDGTFFAPTTSQRTIGYGIGAGLFDRDGWIDLALGDSVNGSSIQLLLGLGGGRFATYSNLTLGGAGGDALQFLVTGDLDGDGDDEVVISEWGQRGFYWFSYDWATAWTNEGLVLNPQGFHSNDVHVADVDGDGTLDVLVSGDSGALAVRANPLGTGQFSAAAVWDFGQDLRGLDTADFDGDGLLDVAVASGGDDVVYVLLGNRGGLFGPQGASAAPAAALSVDAGPRKVKAGDLDGDGRTDLVVTCETSGTISVLLNRTTQHGTPTFGPAVSYAVGATPMGLAVLDLDGDGQRDAVVTSRGDDTMAMLAGKGDGTFGAPALLSTFPEPCDLVARDFDGDGRPDVAIAHHSGALSVYLNHGTVCRQFP